MPCLPDSHGKLHIPAELFLLTPDTEPLRGVEPFIRLELDTERTKPLLKLLGVRDTPADADKLLARLHALSAACWRDDSGVVHDARCDLWRDENGRRTARQTARMGDAMHHFLCHLHRYADDGHAALRAAHGLTYAGKSVALQHCAGEYAVHRQHPARIPSRKRQEGVFVVLRRHCDADGAVRVEHFSEPGLQPVQFRKQPDDLQRRVIAENARDHPHYRLYRCAGGHRIHRLYLLDFQRKGETR